MRLMLLPGWLPTSTDRAFLAMLTMMLAEAVCVVTARLMRRRPKQRYSKGLRHQMARDAAA